MVYVIIMIAQLATVLFTSLLFGRAGFLGALTGVIVYWVFRLLGVDW
jgi:hypothetical protein